MQTAILILDLAAIAAALLAAWLWYRASGHRIRRVARGEHLDSADFNRIIVSINRSQIRNTHAALATAASAVAVAVRMIIGMFSGG